jgi:hypothetical protein
MDANAVKALSHICQWDKWFCLLLVVNAITCPAGHVSGLPAMYQALHHPLLALASLELTSLLQI